MDVGWSGRSDVKGSNAMSKPYTDDHICKLLSQNWPERTPHKAVHYVDAFDDRARIGNRIEGYVQGNYGTYRVSIDVSSTSMEVSCSCPAGATWDDCKHVIALAKTFIEFPESFPLLEELSWKDIVGFEDLHLFSRTNSVESLVTKIRREGMATIELATILDMALDDLDGSASFDEEDDFGIDDLPSRTLLQAESRVIKIALLWVLERIATRKAAFKELKAKDAEARQKKRKKE